MSLLCYQVDVGRDSGLSAQTVVCCKDVDVDISRKVCTLALTNKRRDPFIAANKARSICSHKLKHDLFQNRERPFNSEERELMKILHVPDPIGNSLHEVDI